MSSYFNFLKLIILCYSLVSIAWANIPKEKNVLLSFPQSRCVKDTVAMADSIVYYNLDPTKRYLGRDSLPLSRISKWAQVSLSQYLKAGVAGVYSPETSAEPGTIQQFNFIRGLSIPLLSPYDLAKNKPLILLDGIPLIDDPSMVYDVQDYSLQPIGAATSLQSIFDLGNIESIQVLKDYSTAGVYGPRAANGLIYITTKQARPGDRRISVNAYTGFTVPNSVTTMNANSEKNFRRPFYEQYANSQQAANYPAYLSDSSNVSYYGPSNWTDLYYKVRPLLSVNASLSGGGTRSNFRVFAGYTGNKIAADATSLKRYQGAFYINMQPKEWITVSSMLHMTRLDRNRNTSLQERFAETRFFPDQSTPLAPNKVMYRLFRDEYEKVIDGNLNNSMVGKISVDFQLGKHLHFSPRFAIDYNENKRDVFWPSTLLNGNNYVSNYFGYNERISFDNLLRYAYELSNKGSLLAELGLSYQSDANKYNYAVGYKGPNDFIKVNIVEGNTGKPEYLKAIGFIPYYYADRMKQRLLSSYARVTYTKPTQYKLAAMVRRDGSSAVQLGARWFTAYNFDGEYNFGQHITADWMPQLKVFASYGRMGIVPDTDKGAVGPYFNGDLGWEGNKGVFSYNGIGTINRPYGAGWIGYDIPWAYHNLFNAGFSMDFNSPISLRVEYYNRHTKNAMINIPTVAESGYRYALKNGMVVRNSGVDLTLDATVLKRGEKRLGWNMSFNVAYNTNQLTALPNNRQELVLGRRKLIVGKRIDQFWLLKNEGIYTSDSEVPIDPSTNKKLSYMNGTALKAGDPRWVDVNNDNRIDDADRQLMGNSMPKYVGGFYSQFTYAGFDLSFQFYFNLDRKIMHANAAKFYDFVNTDESNQLNAVRDITFWEKNIDESRYPRYNPWSAVDPYQAEQDLFMENGSFLKLRNMTLGYDLKNVINRRKMVFHACYVYLTASNLLTLSSYSGRDPELTDFTSYDYGNGLRFPKNFTLGVKLDF